MSKKQKFDLSNEANCKAALQYYNEIDSDDFVDNEDGEVMSEASEVEDNLEIEASDEDVIDLESDEDSASENRVLILKNGTTWKKDPPKLNRLKIQDKVKTKPGLTCKSKSFLSIAECLKLFIDDEMLDIIVEFTNQKDGFGVSKHCPILTKSSPDSQKSATKKHQIPPKKKKKSYHAGRVLLMIHI
ncbi:hypothetical protein RN001_001627 [Aquatica leii]|uniref:Uncharacterized protein n=1 Tax=Aquatica leii TaxID=1421715 RepID=A0AAN7PLE6_9COLE|nr:hypothetical protein RN001_001627 [Aquatica leii]